jgi:hypothetical protein
MRGFFVALSRIEVLSNRAGERRRNEHAGLARAQSLSSHCSSKPSKRRCIALYRKMRHGGVPDVWPISWSEPELCAAKGSSVLQARLNDEAIAP